MVTWSCLVFPFARVPTSIFLAWNLIACSLTFEDHVRSIVSVFQKLVFRLVKPVIVAISVLLRCCYAFVLPVLEYCSPVWESAAECHLQHVERQVYSVARHCIDQTFLLLCHRRHVAALCMLYKVNSNSNHCLFNELLPAYVKVRHTRAVAAA